MSINVSTNFTIVVSLACEDAHPTVADRVELINIDVSDDKSVQAAAESLRSKGVKLYALVNNAGVGFQTGPGSVDQLMQVNFYGPKRVTDAFLDLIDAEKGRIVNTSSGAASMWLRNQSAELKTLFSSGDTTWEQLVEAVNANKGSASMGAYGLSKAALTCYTIQQAKMYPNLICASLSPGFIQTKMTNGFGAKLSPAEGTVSLRKCLFGDDVVSG